MFVKVGSTKVAMNMSVASPQGCPSSVREMEPRSGGKVTQKSEVPLPAQAGFVTVSCGLRYVVFVPFGFLCIKICLQFSLIHVLQSVNSSLSYLHTFAPHY